MFFPIFLLLLISYSDSFDGISSEWMAGSRGIPDVSFAMVEGDSCLVLRATNIEPISGIDDYVRSFLCPILLSSRPFCQCHIWLPPFDQWPIQPNVNGNYIYAGFRITETRDQQSAFLWPGIFIGRSSGGAPAFFVRVLTGFESERPVSVAGWWTLGLGWDMQGVMSFYAASGQVSLTEADRFATDTQIFPVHMQSVNGWFLDVFLVPGQTLGDPWYFGDVELWLLPPRSMYFPITYPLGIDPNSYEWHVESSLNFSIWTSIPHIVNGDTWEVKGTPGAQQEFFRLQGNLVP